NQDLPVSKLRELLKGKYRSALFLTTHELFPGEKAELNSIGLERLEVRVLSDLMNDKEMEAIDDRSSKSGERYAGLPQSFPHFHEQTLYEKNELAYRRLKENYKFSAIMIMPGLGVSEKFWKQQDAILIANNKVSFMTRLINKVNAWRAKLDNQEMYFVES